MPGPFFSNNASRRGLDQTVPRTYTIWGQPPLGGNVGEDDSPVDCRLLAPYIEQARALRYALDGTETSGDLGDPSSITAGHKHEEAFDGSMPWMQVGSWQHSTVVGGVISEARATWTTTSTTYADLLFVPVVIPIGVTHVYPRFFVQVAGSSLGGAFKFDFFSFGSYTTPAVIGGELTVVEAAGVSLERRLVSADSRGYDVSGIATTSGHRLLVLRVQAKSLDANSFSVFETQLLANQQGYRPYPTRVPLNTTAAENDATLSQAKLAMMVVSNPAVLRKLTYGTTVNLPTKSTQHDHAQNRGEVLKRNFQSTSYGPHTREGAAYSATVGLPLNEPDVGVSFATNPKLIVRQAIWVPGQISDVRVVLTGKLSGSSAPRTVSVKVEIRPLDEDYKTPGAVSGIVDTIVFSTAADGFVSGSAILETKTLGDVSGDRTFELCVWQTTNPASGETYRLCGSCAFYITDPSELLIREFTSYPASESIQYSQIRTGQELTGLVFARANRVLNQCAQEVLGGVQGYSNDGRTLDTTKPWRRRIAPNQAHQHRGSYTDSQGVKVDDGAVLRYPLVSQAFAFNISGDTVEAATSDANPARGMKIHASGALNTTDWLYTGGLCTIAQGLGAIEIRALIQPVTTNPRGRLYCFATVVAASKNVAVTNEIDSNIITAVNSGNNEGTDNYSAHSAAGETFCEVHPEDSAAWIENRKRLKQGVGCWTVDALKQSALDSRAEFTYAARWTQVIRAEIAPTGSIPYRIRVRWALQTGDQAVPTAGTYDSDARILAVIVTPARGY